MTSEKGDNFSIIAEIYASYKQLIPGLLTKFHGQIYNIYGQKRFNRGYINFKIAKSSPDLA